jgi:hypothetical protein
VPFGKTRLSFFGVGEWKNHPEKLQKQTVDVGRGLIKAQPKAYRRKPDERETRRSSTRGTPRALFGNIGLERDDFSSNRHPPLPYCWSMIFSENRYPLFGIML